MSTIETLWVVFGKRLGVTWRETNKLGREMEYQLCFHFGTPEEKGAWRKSEEAQQQFDVVQTAVRLAFELAGNPVTYIGDHVSLADGTMLRYPD